MVNAKLIDCLSSLYVFNPDYCQRDGDEPKKVLFYYPKEKSLDAQVQDVGFAEASVRFSDTFGGQQAPDMYEWSSGRFVSVCRRPEPRFYIGATFARQQATSVGYPLRADVIGEQLVDKAGLESTKQRLEFFFNRYISSSKLSCTLIPDLIDGMRYLRIDRQSVFKLITLVDEAVEMFPFIHWNMLLYNDCLLHNSIPTASVTTFYRYITTMLIPLTARSELRPEVLFSGKGCSILDDEQQQKQPEQQQRYGHFFSTSEGQSLADGQLAARRLPTVHLRVECNKPEREYGLAVYRLLNFTWAMVVPKCGDDDRGQAEVGHLFAEFDRRFGPSIDSLVCKLTDAYDAEQQWPSSTVPSGGGGAEPGAWQPLPKAPPRPCCRSARRPNRLLLLHLPRRDHERDAQPFADRQFELRYVAVGSQLSHARRRSLDRTLRSGRSARRHRLLLCRSGRQNRFRLVGSCQEEWTSTPVPHFVRQECIPDRRGRRTASTLR
ncbi:Vacuolar fusion protein [Trichinella spiralis]|uniref:Vacuolar fusion protein n=1 Tax=Trichinella spiralis TaxID=6334 RepID=A0ABR3KVI8_TRISP